MNGFVIAANIWIVGSMLAPNMGMALTMLVWGAIQGAAGIWIDRAERLQKGTKP